MVQPFELISARRATDTESGRPFFTGEKSIMHEHVDLDLDGLLLVLGLKTAQLHATNMKLKKTEGLLKQSLAATKIVDDEVTKLRAEIERLKTPATTSSTTSSIPITSMDFTVCEDDVVAELDRLDGQLGQVEF